jgi:hypothetical protein
VTRQQQQGVVPQWSPLTTRWVEMLALPHPQESVRRRLCAKCGIVEIRGERAQGFVDVRSCSSVGSIKLYRAQLAFFLFSQVYERNSLHEFESSTRTPWQMKGMVEYVSEQNIVSGKWFKEASCSV